MDWKPLPAPEPETSSAKTNGRGKGKAKAKAQEPAEAKPPEKKKPKTSPAFLTNLVRCGNQMSSASSWNILKSTIRQIIRSISAFDDGAQLDSYSRRLTNRPHLVTAQARFAWNRPQRLMRQRDVGADSKTSRRSSCSGNGRWMKRCKLPTGRKVT